MAALALRLRLPTATAACSPREAQLEARFRTLARHGVRVVRWYAFPGDAWQVARGAGDAPASLQGTQVFPDMDAAVALAAHYDIYLDFVLFSDTRTIPATWMSDPAQRAQLAGALAPMFRRYAGNPHVLSWELFDEPERGVDAGAVAAADVQATVQSLTAEIHRDSHALVSIGPESVDRIGLWTGLGLDFYAPHWFSGMAGTACALCTERLPAGGVVRCGPSGGDRRHGPRGLSERRPARA